MVGQLKCQGESKISAEAHSLRAILAAHWTGTGKVSELAKKSPDLLPPLTELLLIDREASIRRDAGWALHSITSQARDPLSETIIESLGKALGDPDPNVRNAAANALGGYVMSLERAGVSRSSIKEVLLPAMPYVIRYGYDKYDPMNGQL